MSKSANPNVALIKCQAQLSFTLNALSNSAKGIYGDPNLKTRKLRLREGPFLKVTQLEKFWTQILAKLG